MACDGEFTNMQEALPQPTIIVDFLYWLINITSYTKYCIVTKQSFLSIVSLAIVSMKGCYRRADSY